MSRTPAARRREVFPAYKHRPYKRQRAYGCARPHCIRAQHPAFPRNSKGSLGFTGPTQEEACNPRRNSKIPPQLEKNHVVPTSLQDEPLARYGVSREVPVSVVKCERVPDTFLATPRNSPTHRVPSRETPRVPTPLHLSPFSPPDGDRSVDSPAWSGRDSRPSRHISG